MLIFHIKEFPECFVFVFPVECKSFSLTDDQNEDLIIQISSRIKLIWDWAVVLITLSVPLISDGNKDISLCHSVQPQFPTHPLWSASLFYFVIVWTRRRLRHRCDIALAHFEIQTLKLCNSLFFSLAYTDILL